MTSNLNHRHARGRRAARILLLAAVWLLAVAPALRAAEPAKPPAGQPFQPPVAGQAVYDFAGILSPGTIAGAESTIDAIEARTGAEIVVYSQQVDYGVETSETEARARALIDLWGVGRAGFDDGTPWQHAGRRPASRRPARAASRSRQSQPPVPAASPSRARRSPATP